MSKTMQRYTDYDKDLHDVVRQLADAAESSASEKKHDVRMATIATNAAATVRDVLERNARRARLYGWITGGVSVTIALVAVIVASSIARNARDMKQSYDRALVRATTEASALQTQLNSNKEQLKSAQQIRKADRSILSSTLEKLGHAYDNLVATTSSLAEAQAVGLGHGHNVTLTPLANSHAKLPAMNLAKTKNVTSQSNQTELSPASTTRSSKQITKLKSAASRRLVNAMRSQHTEARGQVEELFEVYPNKSGSCITSR